MKHPNDSIQSQYAASPIIRALVDAMNVRIDPKFDIRLFYEKIFDIYTAEGWGLDNWGRILALGRLIDLEPEECFGFEFSLLDPFDQNVFFQAGPPRAVRLGDESYRRLLLYKAAANIAASDLGTLNRLLNAVFADTPGMYILETGPMTIRYVFEFYLSAMDRAMLRLTFVPPRPAGVGYDFLEVDPASVFGFNGSELQPFDQGNFTRGPYVPYIWWGK